MAWLVGDGFDFYNVASDLALNAAVWASESQCISVSGGRFGTGRCLQLGNNSATAGNIITTSFTNSATIFVNMNILTTFAHAAGDTTQCIGFTLRDGGAVQCGLYLRKGGDFVLTSGAIGSTVLATSPVLMPLGNSWAHIQAKIVVNNTAGLVELRIDGNTTANWLATGLNTRNGTANLYANNINVQGNDPFSNFCDDFYAFNDQSPAPSTFQGDVHAIQQLPTVDTSITWTRNTGTNNCLAVADKAEDGDATYVATSVVNNIDMYGMTPLSPTPVQIIAVCPKYLARMDDAGPHTMNASLTSGGTTVSLPNYSLTGSYAYQQAVYTTDPATLAAWTAAGVNNLQMSIKDIL